MMRRRGRPGLVGMAARTAVVAGTATAVSGNVQRRQMAKAQDQQAEAAQEQQATAGQAPPDVEAQQAAAPAPAAAAPTMADKISQIKELGELKAQGLLTDEEFATEKARVLAS
jgi:hypothetical protein